MTKREIIDKLRNEYGVKESVSSLNNKKLAELEDMLKEYESKVKDKENEETKDEEETEEISTEDVNELEKDEETDTEKEVVFENKTQLPIFREVVFPVRNRGVSVKVENLGYGDMYVSEYETEVGNEEQLLRTGEKKVFEGVDVVKAISASQPIIKISEIK